MASKSSSNATFARSSWFCANIDSKALSELKSAGNSTLTAEL